MTEKPVEIAECSIGQGPEEFGGEVMLLKNITEPYSLSVWKAGQRWWE